MLMQAASTGGVESEQALQRQLAKKLGLKGRKSKADPDDLSKLLVDSGMSE